VPSEGAELNELSGIDQHAFINNSPYHLGFGNKQFLVFC
jgi:hypothetical protein